MNVKEKYEGLFKAIPKAPLADFLEKTLEGLNPEVRSKLIIEQVSYNRYSPEVDTLEAFLCLSPVEKNQWIWARVERDLRQESFEEHFFVSSAEGKFAMDSMAECIGYYSLNTKGEDGYGK